MVWRLASAFHEVTEANADLVLFVTLGASEVQLLQHKFPRLQLLHPDDVLKVTDQWQGVDLASLTHAAFRRYAVIGKWLEEHANSYGRVIMTDTRDIALFDDPFTQIDAAHPGAQAFTEVVTYKYDHWYNQGWVRNCYGQQFLGSIMDELVTCCGTIAAGMRGMISYLRAFLTGAKAQAGL